MRAGKEERDHGGGAVATTMKKGRKVQRWVGGVLMWEGEGGS